MLRVLTLSFLCCAFQVGFAFSQESTAEEFQELGELMVGRWTAEVTLIADWPGLKKKAGDQQIVYNTRTWQADKKAILQVGVGGETTGIALWGFDPAAKRIFGRQVGSAGGSVELTITKESNTKWNWKVVAGGLPTGEKFGGEGFWQFGDGGKTMLIEGDVTIDGQPTPKPLSDTYIRLDTE